MNSGASLLHCKHKSFQSALSCAVCAQILMSSFGKAVSADLACETRFLRRPVLFCARPSTKPKSVWRSNRVGAIRATCPSHLVDRLPTIILQSGTPSIFAHLSLVMCCSRMRTQEIPSIPRIFSYQNLLIRRHAASRGANFRSHRGVVEFASFGGIGGGRPRPARGALWPLRSQAPARFP